MLSVVFEDSRFLVINKPAGLAVQGGAGVKTCVLDVLRKETGREFWLVHRLDRDTSGALAVAKSAGDAAFFQDCLKRGQVAKYYLAVCKTAAGGAFNQPGASGVIRADVAVRGRRGERSELPAATEYRVLSADDERTVFELHLLTGRMHQIRKHLAGAGYPLLGDDKYGDFALNRRLRKEQGIKHLLLHALRLEISAGSYQLNAIAPLPEHWPEAGERDTQQIDTFCAGARAATL
jgi:23S rRNA pseudouridine955/2504/2580 synthase